MRRLFPLLLPVLFAAGACSEPPNREIDTAQGAIDAARAAGAEQYAPEPFSAATTALQQAHDAVAQRDYRLALTRALDAHARAQEAARGAADGKARALREAESAIEAAAKLLQQLQTRLNADTGRVPKRDVAAVRRAHADATRALQKARASFKTGAYLEARNAAREITKEITAHLDELEVPPPRTARPGRRRR